MGSNEQLLSVQLQQQDTSINQFMNILMSWGAAGGQQTRVQVSEFIQTRSLSMQNNNLTDILYHQSQHCIRTIHPSELVQRLLSMCKCNVIATLHH